MIALILAQLAARWGQALTLLVLSAAVTTAAVTAPVYAAAVDEATVTHVLAEEGPTDRLVSFPPAARGGLVPAPSFETYDDVLSTLPSFDPVTTIQVSVLGLRPELPVELTRLLARDGFCPRARFTHGRCPFGSREVALPALLAELAEFGPGDQIALTPAVLGDGGPLEIGPPERITVVGVFEPRDPADPYWRTGLDPLGTLTGRPAIFTNRTTLETWEHESDIVQVDAVLPAEALTPDRIPEILAELAAADLRAAALTDIRGSLRTSLPSLLEQISQGGDQARALLPITAAPLVALGWLVVHLAVGHGVSARRRELGVVAVRGPRSRTRALLAAAESVVPVLVGAPVGVVAAHALARAASPVGAGSWLSITVDQEQLLAAGLALAGTLMAVAVALGRELAAPVAQLLRRIPPRRRLAVAGAEVLVVVLAVVLVLDLRWFDRELTGLWVVVPAVVMLAVALLVARALRPLIDRAGRWTMRRGWLGPALAALYLARRPGAARLLVALALVLGMLGLAMTSQDVAAQGRDVEASRTLGADRVLTVTAGTPDQLLAAVRTADPEQRYAMAVVPLPATRNDPARLAVDSGRLAAVATWQERYGPTGPDQVAALLRPPAPEPVQVGDGELVAELALAGRAMPDGAVTVAVELVPGGGGPPVVAELGPLSAGQRIYRAEVAGCPQRCRLAGLTLRTNDDVQGGAVRLAVVVAGLELAGTDVFAGGWLTDADRWRVVSEGAAGSSPLEVAAVGDGLLLTHPAPAAHASYPVLPVDVPYPLPVVTAAAVTGELVGGLDETPVPVSQVADLPALPGLPGSGVLVDLEYAVRSAQGPIPDRLSQVWLTADAPDAVVDRLQEEGLVVRDDRTTGSVRESLDRAGPALALGFFPLAGGLAVLVGLVALGLVAAVERDGWRKDLRQLRRQGLGRRATARAGRWSYGVTVLAAVVSGALAVVGAWLVAGDRLPLGVDRAVLPPWPQWPVVLVPWAAVAAGLLVVAVVAGSRMRRDSKVGNL